MTPTKEMKDFRVETAPEGVCLECLARLGTGLVAYERDWTMWGSAPEWHTERRLDAKIELREACRLSARSGDGIGRPVIWKVGDSLVVRSSPGGIQHMWRALAREGSAPPNRDLKHIVVENDSRKGDAVAVLCALRDYRLDATPADVLLAQLVAESAAKIEAEAAKEAEAEAKRRAEREAQWRAQVVSHMADESIKSAAVLLSAQRAVAAVGTCSHFGSERTVRVGPADAIKLALAGCPDLDKLAVVLTADDYVSGPDAGALREPIVKLSLKRTAYEIESILAMEWSARDGVPIAAVAEIVRALFTVGVPRSSLIETDSLEEIDGRGLAGVLLAEIDGTRR